MSFKKKNQAQCAGFLAIDIIYCALNKRCPKENENNVLQQQNMHNKEAIAYGFPGFLTLLSTSLFLHCFKLMCISVLPCKYSEGLPAPERKLNTFKSLLQWHQLCLGLPEPWVHSLAGCIILLLLLVDLCWSFLCNISSCEWVFLSSAVQSTLTANQNVAG